MIEISTLKALAPYVTGSMKLFSIAKMMIWGLNKYQMRRLRRFLTQLETELSDGQAIQKLIEMANHECHQDRIGQLLEKVRRSETIWTTACLAGVVANYMRRGVLDTEDTLIADVLTDLTDVDLELFVSLKSIYEMKVKEDAENNVGKSAAGSESNEVNIRPQVRVEEQHMDILPNKRPQDLQVVRTRVDRLVRSGALSGDLGGFGGSGVAHGTFLWNEFSDVFYTFVLKFRKDSE